MMMVVTMTIMIILGIVLCFGDDIGDYEFDNEVLSLIDIKSINNTHPDDLPEKTKY